VERHERHDERRRRVSAEEAVTFCEHHSCTRIRRSHGSAKSRRAAANDEHVGISGNNTVPRRQLECLRVPGT
jgi:hypothetical protein